MINTVAPLISQWHTTFDNLNVAYHSDITSMTEIKPCHELRTVTTDDHELSGL